MKSSLLVSLPIFLLSVSLGLQASFSQIIWPTQQGPIVTPPIQGPIVMPGQPIFTNPQFPPGTIIQQGQVFPGQVFPGQVLPGQVFPGQVVMPGQPWPGVNIPRQPAVLTPNTITGQNFQTGGWNTANTQVDNTAWAPGRDMSQLNNRQWVQRPVFDQWGRQTGYQEGWVWRNVYSGQEHGNLQSFTPNQAGGVHQGTILYKKDN